ncbi:MAG: FKBP-type peptidyl-prolyl cis-trans isomerase [Myxococcota bacterium]
MRRVHWVVMSLAAAFALTACDENKEPTGAANKTPAANIPAGQEPPSDVAAAPGDAQKTKGGVAYKVLSKGDGDEHAEKKDSVRIEYTAWTPDGVPFSSSKTYGRPARVGLEGVVPGLAEVLGEMVKGEERRVWIPANLATSGWPNPPEGKPVTMDIKVLEIVVGPKKIPVPENVAAPPKDAKKSKSGLAWKVLKEGEGKVHPKADQTVKVHYSGWTTDGKMFDSSEAKGKPASFPLGAVIAGWTEGVQLMVEGEKRRFWIPVELAYNNAPGKPAGMLVFDIELLEIVKPPEAPKNVAKPPADAEKTESGLASKVLEPGKGKKHPKATSRVKVEYTGWTTDGKMFDSSITRGRPASFSLTSVIPGWTEGLQLMVEGEKRRFWIPEDLAYKGQRGKPKGMLVFDVELLEIQPSAY